MVVANWKDEKNWLKYLRPELKFDGIDALIAQLKQDEQDTRDYFKTKRG